MASRVVSVLGTDADELLASPYTVVILFSSVLMMMNADMIAPLLPVIMGEYAVSETRIGLVMTALTLPAVVFVPIMGIAADKFSRRFVLSASLLLTGFAGLGISVSQTFDQLLVLRALQGIGYSGVQPVTVTLLGDLYEGPKETTAQGLRTFFNNIASSLLPPISGALLVISWQVPFLLYTIHIPVAILAFFLVPAITTEKAAKTDEPYYKQIGALLSERKIILLFVAGFSMFFLRFGVVTYIPLLLTNEFGVSAGGTGIYVGLMAMFIAIGASQAGRLSHFLSHKWTLQIGLFVTGITLLIIPFTGIVPFPVTVGLILCYGFFWGLTAPTQKSMINQIATVRVRAGMISASYTVQNVGKAVAPVATGFAIASAGYQVGFATLCLLPLATALVFFKYR